MTWEKKRRVSYFKENGEKKGVDEGMETSKCRTGEREPSG